MHIQLLDNTLLFQIIKYCNIDDLKNLLYLNKNFESMRIYRLYLGIIAKNNYALTCINNINDYIKYDDYKLNDYLDEIIEMFNFDSHYFIYSISKKIMTYKISNLRNLLHFTLEDAKKYWKNKEYENRDIKELRVSQVYRLPWLYYKYYKNNYGYNLLAIIY